MVDYGRLPSGANEGLNKGKERDMEQMGLFEFDDLNMPLNEPEGNEKLSPSEIAELNAQGINVKLGDSEVDVEKDIQKTERELSYGRRQASKPKDDGYQMEF